MKRILRRIAEDSQAQDLIEYTLLLAALALGTAALILGTGGSITSIWTQTNQQLVVAAGGGTSAGGNVPAPGGRDDDEHEHEHEQKP